MFSTILSFVAAHFLYLALHLESGSFPKPFSARQEQEAFARLREGDAAAREELICRNLRLVAHIAKKYYSSGEDQDDLVSIGTIGLIKAVDSFDSEKGARFATYAARCIENAILTSLHAAPRQKFRAAIEKRPATLYNDSIWAFCPKPRAGHKRFRVA